MTKVIEQIPYHITPSYSVSIREIPLAKVHSISVTDLPSVKIESSKIKASAIKVRCISSSVNTVCSKVRVKTPSRLSIVLNQPIFYISQR